MTAARTDTAAYVRGKLFMARVSDHTPLALALDVITVLAMEVPVDELRKWRQELDVALWRVRPPDRDTWGLAPEQIAATDRLTRGAPG